jgi:hypothetical protein
MSGLHKQVGEIKKRDKAVRIDVGHALDGLLHSEWRERND